MSENPPGQKQDAGRSSIARMMAKGGLWMVLARFAVRIVGFVSTLILARLLVPADFGLVALATSIVNVLETMTEFSFELALIRDQNSGREHYDTAWTLAFFKQALLAVALALGAAAFADFFNEPRLESIFYILAVASLMDGLTNIGVVDFRKHFQFDKQFWFLFAPKIGAFVVTVALAFAWRSYWALLAGLLSSKVIRIAMSYVLSRYRPRAGLKRVGELVHFSKWLLINNILIFFNVQLDTFVIGRLLGVQAVGLYNLAKEVALLPTTELVWPLMEVVLPGFSRVAHDRAELAKGYLHTLGIVWLVGAPAGIGIALVSDLAVYVLLGDNWIDAIPLMQILAVAGALRVLNAAAGSVYVVIGRPQLVAWLAGVGLAVFGPTTYFMVQAYGALGAAYALILTTTVMATANCSVAARILQNTFGETVAQVWRPAVATLAMAATILAVRALWDWGDTFGERLIELCTLVILGAGVYAAGTMILWILCKRPLGPEVRLFSLMPRPVSKLLACWTKLPAGAE